MTNKPYLLLLFDFILVLMKEFYINRL